MQDPSIKLLQELVAIDSVNPSLAQGGDGLHGLNEYVIVEEVILCRNALIELAREFCEG